MKRFVLTGLLAAFASLGQQQETKGLLVTYGIWPVCESVISTSLAACQGFQPGNETYMLLVSTNNPSVVAYKYSVTATLVKSGEQVTLEGVAPRQPGNSGYTSIGILTFGGVVTGNSAVTTQGLVPAENRLSVR